MTEMITVFSKYNIMVIIVIGDIDPSMVNISKESSRSLQHQCIKAFKGGL